MFLGPFPLVIYYVLYSAAATPRIPTTATIPAATAPVDCAAPAVEVLELIVAVPARAIPVCPPAVTLVCDVVIEDPVLLLPVLETIEPVSAAIEPVVLARPPPAVAPAFALESAVALLNSAAAVAMPPNPVYVCK